MLRNVLNFLKPQDLSSRELQATLRVLQTVLLISLLGALGTLAAIIVIGAKPQAFAIVIAMVALLLVSFILLRQRILLPARIMAPLSLYVTITFLVVTGSGIHDIAMIAYAGILILASLTLGRRATFVFAGLIIAAVFGVGLAEMYGWLVTDASFLATIDDPVLISIVVLVIALTQVVLINRINLSAQEARENEAAQVEANRELTALKDSLEVRIAERTTELERRAAQFELVSSVARSITAVQDIEQLLPSICQVVSDRFGFYHTGIFLLDERAEYAVLQATNSEGGRQMLKRGHRLRVGTASIVGHVASQGEPRVTPDVEADAVYFHNPDLPTTRSEMSLPLKIGGQTIGVLDVQSQQVNAFQEEDVAVLGILSNQVAVAIENARLFSQTREALSESQAIYQQYVKQDWARFSQTLKYHGYTYDGIKTSPLGENLSGPGTQGLTIPVKIRGLVVGQVMVHSANPRRQWTQDEINLAQSAAERAGLAIDNIRLLTEAQRRAAKEQTIGEITSRIGASINMSAILQTAVEELGRALPDSEVVLQFREQKMPTRPVDRPGRETQ